MSGVLVFISARHQWGEESPLKMHFAINLEKKPCMMLKFQEMSGQDIIEQTILIILAPS